MIMDIIAEVNVRNDKIVFNTRRLCNNDTNACQILMPCSDMDALK